MTRTAFAVLAFAAVASEAAFLTPARCAAAVTPRCVSPACLAKKAAKKAKSKPKAGASGFGAKTAVSAGPTSAELLKRSMAVYEELERGRRSQNNDAAAELDKDDDVDAADKEEAASTVTKYCVTLRSPSANEFADWVPVALLAFECGAGTNQGSLVPGAIGASCREVLESGCSTFPSLRKVARETIEYGYEPLDDFETHVYSGLVGRGARRADALTVLGLEPGSSAADVKKAHRKLMGQLHPDSFIGDEDEGAAEAAKERMLAVQDAYAELGGGQGAGSGSWYEAVGGKARVSFSGTLARGALGPMGKLREEQGAGFEQGGWRAGVFPMDADVTREFVTRNVARASASS